jgi:hypothetical protein
MEVQNQFRLTWGAQGDAEWVKEHDASLPAVLPTWTPKPTALPVSTPTPVAARVPGAPAPQPALKGSTSANSSTLDWIDPRKIAVDPTGYTGKGVKLVGKILNATKYSDYTWAQFVAQVPAWIDPQSTYETSSFAAEFSLPSGGNQPLPLLPGNCYLVVGWVGVPQQVTRTLTGASDVVPTIAKAVALQQLSKDAYGNCIVPATLA